MVKEIPVTISNFTEFYLSITHVKALALIPCR